MSPPINSPSRPQTPAPPPPQNDEHLVEPGETLGGIARQHATDVPTLQTLNPQIRNPDRIYPGDRVKLPKAAANDPADAAVQPPVQPTQAPASPQAARVDKAVQEVSRTQGELAYHKQEVARGNEAMKADVRDLDRQLAGAQDELKAAVSAEIDSRTGAKAGDAAVAKAGQDIAARYADPNQQKAVTDAVAGIRTDRQAQGIVAAAQAKGNPGDAVKALGSGTANVAQPVKDAVLADPGAKKILADAAAWVNQPLTDKPSNGTMPQGQTASSMQRLEQITQGLDKQTAAALVAQTLPGYEAFAKANADHLGGSPLGMQGMTSLMNVTGRIAGTPQGDAAIARYAGSGAWQTDAVRNAIGNGADPAYAIEFARQMKAAGSDPKIVVQTIDDGIVQRDLSKIAGGESPAATLDVARRMQAAGIDASGVVEVATDGVQKFKDKVADDVKQLAQHDAELSWLVQNDGAGLSPQQLNQAVSDYRAGKGADWQNEETRLRQQVAADGTKLTEQMIALNEQAPAGAAPAIDDALKKIAADPSAELAISTALQTDPKLADDAHAASMANLFAFSKLGDVARKFTNEAASAYVRTHVLDKMQGVDLHDPASVATAKQAIGDLKNENFAKLLGVTKGDLDKAVKAVEDAVGKAGTTPAEMNKALQDLNKKLDTDAALSKTFNKETVPGQLLRGIGVAFAGASLYNSYQKAAANPGDIQNDLKVMLDAAGFAQKNAEVLVGLGAVDKASKLGQFGGEWKLAARATAGDLIAGVSAVFDGISAVRSGFGIGTAQDTGNAIFSATTAVGGALTVAPAFGAAAWLGPVGLGVTAVGVVGKLAYDAIKNAHQYEGASEKFLHSAGYDAEAAAALSKQGGVLSGAAGSGQLPFLQKYAELKHVPADRLQQWINNLSPDQVQQLSKRVLQTAGDSGGDPGRFTDGPAQTTLISTGSPFPARVTLANTVGVFEKYLDGDGVPHL
jgi:LysM repeat protein